MACCKSLHHPNAALFGRRGRCAPTIDQTHRLQVSPISQASGRQPVGLLNFKRTTKQIPEIPQGDAEDAARFRAALVALSAPTALGLLNPQLVLENGFAFDSIEAGLESIEAVQHLSGLITCDSVCVLALAVLYILARASKEGELDGPANQVLCRSVAMYASISALALCGASAGPALGTWQAPAPTLAADATALVVAALCVASSGGAVAKYGNGGVSGAVKAVAKDFKDMAALDDNEGGKLELYYKVSFWSTMIVGGSFAFSPESPLAAVNDPTASGQILTHCFGLGAVLMLGPVQFVLAKAARANQMGKSKFKLLNLATVAAITGINSITIYGGNVLSKLEARAGVDILADSAAMLTSYETTDYNPIFNYFGALGVATSICAVYLYQGIFAVEEA